MALAASWARSYRKGFISVPPHLLSVTVETPRQLLEQCLRKRHSDRDCHSSVHESPLRRERHAERSGPCSPHWASQPSPRVTSQSLNRSDQEYNSRVVAQISRICQTLKANQF